MMENTTTSIFSLSGELRNRIYKLLLLNQQPVDPSNLHLLPNEYTPGLFRVSKRIHVEAASLFYAQNCFDLTSYNVERTESFLDRIGRNNANYIRHICIDFPNFQYLTPDNVTLGPASIRMLARLQSDCANLSTLTTSLHSTDAMETKLDALDHPKMNGQALTLVNNHFRAISSLQDIIVNVYENDTNDQIRREMKMHGWTISTTAYVAESVSDDSFDDIRADDYYFDGYGHSDHSDDVEYDIDDDSDFWRRAGD